MDYNYIRLEGMIKQLMNKNYVPSSSSSQNSKELINGNAKLYFDTILNHFVFKYLNLEPSLSIDPINRTLLNVAYINNVDVTKLIGGVEAGYGIKIIDMGGGI